MAVYEWGVVWQELEEDDVDGVERGDVSCGGCHCKLPLWLCGEGEEGKWLTSCVKVRIGVVFVGSVHCGE